MNLEKIVQVAVEQDASDIHILPGKPVYFRRVGELVQATKDPIDKEQIEEWIKTLDGKIEKKFHEKHQADFSLSFGNNTRVRANLFRQLHGPALALRIINSKIKTMAEIGMPQSVSNKFKQLRSGLVLIVGATGQGKSTTMATILNEKIEQNAFNLITIEDPIEYVFSSNKTLISQRQVGDDVEDFASGIIGGMREDPDILMVGEMRDYETISAAISLAETGHLVISTMHSNDCIEVLSRIIDSFPTAQQNQVRVQLASVLKMVVAQKLLPSVDKARRVLAYEIMYPNYAIASKIRDGNLHQIAQVFEVSAKEGGMVSFERCLLQLVQSGQISMETARLNATDVGKFNSLAGD